MLIGKGRLDTDIRRGAPALDPLLGNSSHVSRGMSRQLREDLFAIICGQSAYLTIRLRCGISRHSPHRACVGPARTARCLRCRLAKVDRASDRSGALSDASQGECAARATMATSRRTLASRWLGRRKFGLIPNVRYRPLAAIRDWSGFVLL